MKKQNCPQTKCAYNQFGGCRNCEVCGTEPNVIDENCDRCWNCAYDEGILRWDDQGIEEKEEELKPIEVRV